MEGYCYRLTLCSPDGELLETLYVSDGEIPQVHPNYDETINLSGRSSLTSSMLKDDLLSAIRRHKDT